MTDLLDILLLIVEKCFFSLKIYTVERDLYKQIKVRSIFQGAADTSCCNRTSTCNHLVRKLILSLEINVLQVSLDKFLILDRYLLLELNFRGFTTPCLFVLNKKYINTDFMSFLVLNRV